LITALMLGNLLREVDATKRLARTAAGGLTNVVLVALTIAIGSTMAADAFLSVQTAEIVLLGLLALVCGVASMMAMAKLMSQFPGAPAYAMPSLAEGASRRGAKHDGASAILVHQTGGPSSAGVFGAAILGGIMLVALGVN